MNRAPVFVKLRPLTTKEKEKNVPKGTKVVDGKLVVGPDSVSYPFLAFGSDVSPSDFYNGTCSSIIKQGLTEGVNVAIICIGESKSGKSTTLGSGGSTTGLVPLASSQLFKLLENNDSFVGVSYLNVFNEKLADILNPCDKDMRIKAHAKLGVYVEGLTELAVKDNSDLQRLYDQGNKVRKIMELEMETPTSKSHTVFIIFTERREKDGSIKRCKIQFYNIAGYSKEDKIDDKVGNSIKAFTNVITSASDPGSETQYNASKLTQLLSDVFGKGCLTAFIGHCVPAESSLNATKVTVGILSRAEQIPLEPTPIVFDLKKMIEELRKRAAVARDAIAAATTVIPKEHLAELDASLAAITAAKSLQWESRERESVLGEEQRRHTLADQGVLEWITDTHKKQKDGGGKVLLLQTEKDKYVADYKKQQVVVDKLKTELQASINQHTIAAESQSEATVQESLAKIHTLRDELKSAKEKDRDLKKHVKEAQDKLKFERSIDQEDKDIQSNFELSFMVANDEISHLKRDNVQFLEEEKERLQSEAEQEISEAKLSATQGHTLTIEQRLALQERIAQQSATNFHLSLHIQCLQAETEKTGETIEALRVAHKAEAETNKMQNLLTFRQYKDFYEESKTAMEAKYQELLNACVQDCVFLSAKNTELSDECADLKRKLKHYER